MKDGQLDECDLTIAELAKVKASFAKTLLSMMHGRIKYQKAVETPPSRDEPKPRLAGDDEVPTASMKIVEASFSGPHSDPALKKNRGRKPPPASAA